MDLLEKIKNLSKKQKAYIGAFLAIVGLLAWAFISAGVITSNFNRSQLQTDQDRQEATIDGIILTETNIQSFSIIIRIFSISSFANLKGHSSSIWLFFIPYSIQRWHNSNILISSFLPSINKLSKQYYISYSILRILTNEENKQVFDVVIEYNCWRRSG